MTFDDIFEFSKRHRISALIDTPCYMKYRGWYVFYNGYCDIAFVKEDLSVVKKYGACHFSIDGVNVSDMEDTL